MEDYSPVKKHNDDVAYGDVKEVGWSYYIGGFGGIEKKKASEESAADYSATQMGTYLMTPKRLNDNFIAGALYSYMSRDLDYNIINKKQKLQTFGSFVGDRESNWYLIDTLTYTAVTHDSTMGTSYGPDAMAFYNSWNIKNHLLAGCVINGAFTITPEVGII